VLIETFICIKQHQKKKKKNNEKAAMYVVLARHIVGHFGVNYQEVSK